MGLSGRNSTRIGRGLDWKGLGGWLHTNMWEDKELPLSDNLVGGEYNKVSKVEIFFLAFSLTFSLPFHDNIHIK